MRHRPDFPAQDTLRVTFTRHDLALYWGYVQGVDPRELHARYRPGQPLDDLRQVRTRARAVAHELAAAARRTDRPLLAGLFLRDPRAIPESDPAAPSLEDFRSAVDPGGDFYSEAELTALWQQEYGRAAAPRGTAAVGVSSRSSSMHETREPTRQARRRARAQADERRARLLARIREALAWIESRIWPAPQPEHPVQAWLPLAYAARLHAAGLSTIGALMDHINTRGVRWHREIRGIGAAKAGEIERWLDTHRRAGVIELQASARMTPMQMAQRALGAANPSPIVPLERLQLPPGLDGRAGRFRAPAELCTLQASNDLMAVREWLNAHASPHTRRAYQREAERLLLWCVLELGRPMSSLTVADCQRYREFLKDPQPAQRWCGRRGTPRWSHAWRPFEGPLKPAAERHALVVLKACGAWLVQQHYLVANPWAALPLGRDARGVLDTRRSFTPAQWQRLVGALDAVGDAGARPRLRCALLLLGGTGLRLSEVVAARVEDLQPQVLSDGSTSVRLRVLGKGGRERWVPVARALLDELQRYFMTRGWPTLADAPARAFVLARSADAARLPRGLAYDPYGPISAGVLYRQLKAFFRWVAKRSAAADPAGAERLRQASTHWLRHTFGTRLVTMTKDVVLGRDLLGHASVGTTSIYLDSDDIEQRDAVERLADVLLTRAGTAPAG
jgi:site-specific recombinase XerD